MKNNKEKKGGWPTFITNIQKGIKNIGLYPTKNLSTNHFVDKSGYINKFYDTNNFTDKNNLLKIINQKILILIKNINEFDKSDDKKRTVFPISFGSPNLFNDKSFVTSFIFFIEVFSFIILVLVKPGAIAFTLILKTPNSFDITLTLEIIAALEEE